MTSADGFVRLRTLVVFKVLSALAALRVKAEEYMKRQRIMLAATTVVATLFLLTMGVTVASADTLLTLGLGNSAISGFPGPYATVNISLTNSTTARITFTTDNVGQYDYFLVDGGSAGVNVNATSWTIGLFSAIAPSFSGGSAATLSNGGAGNEDGWGSFNQTVNNADSYPDALTQLAFTLTNTSGTWANSASVLTPNASGYAAAAHIAVCDTVANPTCATSPVGAAATGFAVSGSSVPDGGMTLMLLGGALVGLETLRRKVRA